MQVRVGTNGKICINDAEGVCSLVSSVAGARLAGAPIRTSPAPASNTSWGRLHEGLIKLRLCHARGRSYLLPDVLIGFEGNRFFIPSFFGPPQLVFKVPPAGSPFGPKHHVATLTIDVAAPRAAVATRVAVEFRSDDRVRVYDDGAQLYRCTYRAPLAMKLSEQVAGECVSLADGDFAIAVFHHTTAANAALINLSGELWSSARNLAGTEELANVSHLYFTTLPTIEDETDLRRVAMSSTARVEFQTTSDRHREAAIAVPVYEGSVDARGSAIRFLVPLGIIAPAHLLFHPMTQPEPAYYEVVGQEIVRVAVKPGVAGTIAGGEVGVAPSGIKRFSYVVEGDASGLEGLVEPVREADAFGVAHIEPLDAGLDLFEFWQANKNRDLHSGRTFEARVLRR